MKSLLLLDILVLQDQEQIMVDELMPVLVPPYDVLLSKSLLEALYAMRISLSEGRFPSNYLINSLQLFSAWMKQL